MLPASSLSGTHESGISLRSPERPVKAIGRESRNQGGTTVWVKFVQGLAGRIDARDEEGQSMVEYSLILFLVSTVGIAAATLVGLDVASVFQGVADLIP